MDNEQTVFKGVHHKEWADWYADYVIQRGLGNLLNQAVTTEQISLFFRTSYKNYQQDHSNQNWADYTAQKMAQELAPG